MKRVLIVSPHFPPVNAPDHQRIRMSLPYFRANGWEPVVLAVDASTVEGAKDALLTETLPVDVAIHRVGALPVRFTRLAGLGNVAYRAYFQLRAAGQKLLREQKFDLVYFSTTQFVVTTLGAKWQRNFGVPYVVDLQDPWRTDYYDRPGAPPPPGGWKYRFARAQAKRLEESAWRDAAGFISVSENYLTELRGRYAWFDAKPATIIPFGGSEADFAFVRTKAELVPAFVREPEAIHLVAVGAVGPIMRGALTTLFRALRDFRSTHPALANRLRFHFVGTSYAGNGQGQESVHPLATEFGVGDLVREQTARVGYFTAIKTLLAADAVVIPGSDDPGYNPSKIATCLLARRPTLALAPAGAVMERMLLELDFAVVARCPSAPPDTTVSDFFRSLFERRDANAFARPPSDRFEAAHSARARTRQQCEFFDRVLGAAETNERR